MQCDTLCVARDIVGMQIERVFKMPISDDQELEPDLLLLKTSRKMNLPPDIRCEYDESSQLPTHSRSTKRKLELVHMHPQGKMSIAEVYLLGGQTGALPIISVRKDGNLRQASK